MIKWKPAAVQAGVKGGGFLCSRRVVELPQATRSKIMGKHLARSSRAASPSSRPRRSKAARSAASRSTSKVAAARSPTPPPPGAFNAVTKILGATKPSMSGQQTAAFSLVLDQEGATILQKAFEQGATPVGVIYELTMRR